MKPLFSILNISINQKNHYSYFVGWVWLNVHTSKWLRKWKKSLQVQSILHYHLMRSPWLITNCGFQFITTWSKIGVACLFLFFKGKLPKEGVQIISLELLWVFWKDGGVFNGGFVKKLMSFGSMFRVKNVWFAKSKGNLIPTWKVFITWHITPIYQCKYY